MRIRRLITIVAATTLLVGCMAQIDSVVASVDPKGWYSGQPKGLTFTNTDTVALNTLSIIVRYDQRLTDSDLRMSVSVITPDSLTMTEEVTVAIPVRRDDDNRASVTVEPFRRHAKLSRIGDYHFEIEPSQAIFGITGIGIEIKNESEWEPEKLDSESSEPTESTELPDEENKQIESTDN